MSQISTVGRFDKAGATASLICAIHCVTLPLLFAVIPAIGLTWLDNPWFDRAFLVIALLFVFLSHPRGYRQHRRCVPAALALCGIMLVGIALWQEKSWALAHHYVVALGGITIATSHWLNRHFLHHACCEGKHEH